MHRSDDGRPAVAVIALAAAVFAAAFYLLSVGAVLLADPSPPGEACQVARGYIVMDDQDIVTGTQAIRWVPVPVTECVWDDGSTSVWSIYHLLGIPLALCIAGVAAWGFIRSANPVEEWEIVDA